jgi:hypothetical protein
MKNVLAVNQVRGRKEKAALIAGRAVIAARN